jgi:uncharacterized RDD family membrane protein YckC
MDNDPGLPAPAPAPVYAPSDPFEPAGFWVRGGAVFLDGLLLAASALVPVKGVPFLLGLAYKTGFVAHGGQTPGKMAAGIRVLRADGEAVAVGRAFGRALAEHLSAVTLGLGYLAAAFGPKRALHDYVAGTRVVYLDGVSSGRRMAFAALGVLGVLAMLGLVVLVAMPSVGKFRQLSTLSGEGATKGNLGSLRAGASIYYGDKEGVYPQTLDELVPRYVPSVPATKLADHPPSAAWTAYGAEVCAGTGEYSQDIDASKIKDTGGWGFVTDPQAACYGAVFVDCTHQDSKGRPWTGF